VFKRLHSYHEFEGTGVGLSICKKIIEKHNGFIEAKSTADKGSTFYFGLPEKVEEPV
jgi:light-regulated signal transduction histidine kinase (bacteriophytochrome)